MKKYIFILVIGLGIFFLPHFSLADSLSNYVNVTSFSQTSSTVTITWDKGSAANMSNEAVYLDANFPTSVEIPSYYPYNADFPTIEALTGSFSRIPDFGTCAAGWNNYSSATSTGNISTLSTAYNADSNSAVRIDTLPAGTLLYLVLSSWGNSGYGCNNTTAPTYQDSYELGSVSTTLSFSPISVIDPISSTTIAEGANTTASVVAFGATLNSNETSTIQLQIEVKPSSVAFVGVSTVESTPFFSGVDATVLSPVLPDGAYHWQARAVDAEGNTSSWQTFNGTSTGTDFVVNGLPSATNQLGLNSICPNISSSTKNLIFITHGWDGYGASSSVFAWVQQMKDSIENILPSPSWGVCAYDWTQDANTLSPQDAFNNAKEDGIKVGKVLAQQDFASIHFIAHSAGSNLIQNAADWIESSTPIVSRPKIQLTFLDAYDPKGNMSSYGENPEGSGTTSDWWAE